MIAGAQLYRWRCKALAGGHAVAMGRTPDEARIRIRIHTREWLTKLNGGHSLLSDDDDSEIVDFHAQLDRDLAADPDQPSDVVPIKGANE